MKFLLGLAVGFTGALLFAPASGAETRRRLMGEAHEFARESREQVEEAAEKVTGAAREKAGEIGGALGREAAESAVDAVLGKKRSA